MYINIYIMEEEIILKTNENRYVLFPIKYPKIWKMAKNLQSLYWQTEEIKLSQDKIDWETKLTNNEKYFIKMVLAFFAASDGIVMENLAMRFSNEVQIPEARYFYAYQIFNEAIHSQTYSTLIETYISDEKERNKLFEAIHEFPSIKRKADWATKWINSTEASFGMRLIAFAVVEGIFFSGSFCAIFWLKNRALMPGLSFSNELISRDEGLHCEFAIELYSMLKNKLKEEEINKLFIEAVEIEKEFITEAITCNMIGMNCEMMSKYIEFVADRLLIQLGYKRIWNSKNPFDFMELISMDGKTNFFERRVAEYSSASTGKKNTDELSFVDDF
jgi:ribonucleotide reductase beta subunit family protein with ferritin-like domain